MQKKLHLLLVLLQVILLRQLGMGASQQRLWHSQIWRGRRLLLLLQLLLLVLHAWRRLCVSRRSMP